MRSRSPGISSSVTAYALRHGMNAAASARMRSLERLEKATKRGLNPEEVRERQILSEIILPALESEKPLREIELDPEDEKRLRGFQLLSAKPLLIHADAKKGSASAG